MLNPSALLPADGFKKTPLILRGNSMKRAIIYGIGMLVIYIAVGILQYVSSLDKHVGKKVIRMNAASVVIGIVGTVCFLVPAIVLAIRGDVAFSLVMLSFSVLSIPLIVAYMNCRIFYDENGLTAQNFWRRKKTILYSEITQTEIRQDIVIYAGKKKVVIYSYMVGRFDFMLTMSPKLDRERLAQPKKTSKQPKVRSLRDSVERFSDFMAAIILLILLGIGILVLMIFSGFYWFILGMSIFPFLLAFLLIHSVRRAHSSKFWRVIAVHLYTGIRLDNKKRQ